MILRAETGPITVAHDYFTQRGGAERVAAAIIDAIAPDRVVTALHSPARTFPLRSPERLETSFLQRIRPLRRDPRRALPALPAAWRFLRPVREGVLICSSAGWSHAMPKSGSAVKIVYCHNPPRWLYQPGDYMKDQSLVVRMVMRVLAPLLVRWDKAAANSADVYIANSTAVAERVRQVYQRESVVLPPPISLDPAGEQIRIDGLEPGYFVSVGRGRGYKNVDLLLAAFSSLPDERLVVVGVAPAGVAVPPNAIFLSDLSDAQLRWLYANARALISVSHEDFGLTPLEANALGTPALVLQAGGFLDSLDEGVSGSYIADRDPKTIASAVGAFRDDWDSAAIKKHADRFSMDTFMRRLSAVVAETTVTASGKSLRGRRTTASSKGLVH